MKPSSKYLSITALVFILAVSTQAYADCSHPAGVEGEQVYNSTHKVMQYCDGTDWTAMRATTKAEQSDLDGLVMMVGTLSTALTSLTSTVSEKVDAAGDSMSGWLTLPGAPAANNHAATKGYVDTVAAASGGGGASYTAWGVTTCASGWDVAYTGYMTAPASTFYSSGGVGTALCLSNSASINTGYTNPIVYWLQSGGYGSYSRTFCAVCVK